MGAETTAIFHKHPSTEHVLWVRRDGGDVRLGVDGLLIQLVSYGRPIRRDPHGEIQKRYTLSHPRGILVGDNKFRKGEL